MMELTNFLGKGIAQTKEAIPLWESLVSSHRPARIIELGTGGGMFSCYLKLLCIQFDAEFHTFDNHPLTETSVSHLLDLRSSFEMLDIFVNEEKIAGLIKRDGLTIMFCDDGDKIREFNMFTKYLKTGDIISAHDWGVEISNQDVVESLIDLSYLPLNEFLEVAAYTKFFIKL